MEQNKSLGLLSLARKGGNIVLGEEQAGAAARASRARLMLLASDARRPHRAAGQELRGRDGAAAADAAYTRDELGDALGTTSCAIAAHHGCAACAGVCQDARRARKSMRTCCRSWTSASKRVEKRRAEEKAHRRNVRHGKS